MVPLFPNDEKPECQACGGTDFLYEFRQFPMSWSVECLSCGSKATVSIKLGKPPAQPKLPVQRHPLWPFGH